MYQGFANKLLNTILFIYRYFYFHLHACILIESFSGQVAVAAVVPSLFTVLLLVLLLVIIAVFIYKYKQNKKSVNGTAESTAYYSTVDPHSTPVASRVQLESVTYEEVKWTTNSSDNVSNLEENVAYGMCA